MTMPTPGTDPNAGQPDPTTGQPHGTPDPNAPKSDAPPKSVDEQLAELTAQMDALKTNSRKWEQRAKENKEKADQFEALQAQNATPDQKLAQAEEKAQKAERELARYKVANETGLPAELIVGDNEDAMRDYATRLQEFAKTAAPKPAPAPKPDHSQGPKSGAKPNPKDLGNAEADRRFGSRK